MAFEPYMPEGSQPFQPSPTDGFQAYNPNMTPDQSSAVLGHANAGLKNFFQTPLTNIASGNSQDNVDVAKGAGKQALSDLSMAGAQNAGPVGKAMLANAPAFSKDIDAFNQAMKPANPAQAEGAAQTTIGEIMAPVGGAKSSGLLSKIADKTGISKLFDNRATQKTVEALTPKLTPTEMIEAGKEGKGVKPLVGASTIDLSKDKGFSKQVDALKGIVQGKSPIQDINSVRSSLSSEAESLKTAVEQSGNNIIYPFKELAADMRSAEEPISLKGTPFEKQVLPLKNAALKLAKQNGGTISSLLDTRKQFDALVEKTWPNLYESESAPMRNAVTAIRGVMNNFIEKNLPTVGFKESLAKQKTFYDAIDNIATKIPDEIKGTATFGKRHPVLKKAAEFGAEAVGAGLIYKEARDLGAPLP